MPGRGSGAAGGCDEKKKEICVLIPAFERDLQDFLYFMRFLSRLRKRIRLFRQIWNIFMKSMNKLFLK